MSIRSFSAPGSPPIFSRGTASSSGMRMGRQDGTDGRALEEREAGTEDLEVAAELVDDEAADARALRVGQEMHRADNLRKDAANVDVGRQETRRVGDLGGAHVDDVALAEIDL